MVSAGGLCVVRLLRCSLPGSLDAFRVRDISIERGDVQRDKERVVREITK